MRRSCLVALVFFHFLPVSRAQPTVTEIKHEGAVLSVAWSVDGKQVAAGNQNGVLRVTEFPSGKEVAVMNAGDTVTGVAFSRDGKLLGVKTNPNGPLSVWDIAGKKKLKSLAFVGYTCSHLAFSSDGQSLLASGPGEHMIWHHAKGGGSGSKSGKVPDGSSAAVSHGGHIAAWSNAAGAVQMFNVQERKFQRMQLGPTTALAFSPDDRMLAAASPDKTIRLWAVQGAELKKFEGLREPANLLHFAANGKVLAAASPGDPVVRLWDTTTTHLRRRVTVGSTSLRAIALAPDGVHLAVANGNKLQIWNVATRELGDLGKAKLLSIDEMKRAWEDLASAEGTRAETAFKELASAQEFAVPFLKTQIRAIVVPPIDWKRIEVCLEDLDDPLYSKREKAMSELARQGEYIRPILEKYLAAKPSLEGEKRASKLLQRLIDPDLTPDRLRCLEAIEILEILNTKESQQVLSELANDALLNQIRLAARDARDRLQSSAKANQAKE